MRMQKWYVMRNFLTLWRDFDVMTSANLLASWRVIDVIANFLEPWLVFDVMTNPLSSCFWFHDEFFLWRHDKLFDVMTSWQTCWRNKVFWRNDGFLLTPWHIFDVMMNFLMSWCKFWRHDVLRNFDVMTYFWRHDVIIAFLRNALQKCFDCFKLWNRTSYKYYIGDTIFLNKRQIILIFETAKMSKFMHILTRALRD